MNRKKTTVERGKFKEIISSALYKNKDILDLLLGDTSAMPASKIQSEFKEHVKSHLFIDDTITKTDSFIFYDVVIPYLHTMIKTCKVVVYAICHRDILENYAKDGYYGNRADILSEMIENTLLNDEDVVKKFGIGDLTLDSIEPYNSTRFYGCVMTFDVPTFR